MQLGKLKFLVCPQASCRESLQFNRDLPWNACQKDSGEILEGFVCCERCGQTYPVLKGILFLVPDVWNYCSKHFLLIQGICEKYGGIFPAIQKELLARVPLPLPKQVPYDDLRKRAFEKESSFYRLSHYGGLGEALSKEEPLFDFLKQQEGISPHDILEGFLKETAGRKKEIALEVGCSVGGFLTRLAARYETVFGIDANFEVLILARKMVRKNNVELVLSQGEFLPFANRTVDLVASANVIDVVEKPEAFLQEQMRLLRKGGKLLLTTPYGFTQKHNGHPASPKQWVQNVLSRQMALEKEEDPVCWIYRKDPRHYEIFYTHCLSAIKRGDVKEGGH